MAVGKKSGGRKKGARNKKTAKLIADIEVSGETPLDYMLRIMRDPKTEHERRDRMAASVAPYVHAKLASMTVAGPAGGPVQFQEIRRIIVKSGQAGYSDSGSVSAASGAESI